MYGEALEEAEDSAFNLIAERLLDTSVGVQLDVWGLVVGERRDGLSDDEYRAFIEARILSNLSNGEIDRLTQILATLGRASGDAPTVLYFPLYPAGMWFNYATDRPATADMAARIVTQMTEVAPAGVGVDFIVETPIIAFQFDGPAGTGFDEGEFGRTL
jgi:hypothetical protein